ncbi:MAG: DUF4136 domain-containing protein [Bacteroidales bacterium]|nr:DUF4136 domain-containing protein [Bacteroidales bacterium]
MKKFNIITILFSISLMAWAQTPLQYHCTYGFTYEMSQQESWGHHKPVILSVTPLSSAAEAGLKPNDIIEKINDNNTEGEKLEVVDEWMHDVNEDQIRLTFSNLNVKNKEVTLTKKCAYSNRITEKDLASSYAFYSLEDIQKRSFVCPFRTTMSTEEDILNYKTFSFGNSSNDNMELENTINQNIRAALEEKGLEFTSSNPDLIIHTYYSYNYNQNYRPNEGKKLSVACRYNVHTKKMEYLPIYDDPAVSLNQAEYSLKLGIRLVDYKKSTPTNLIVVWESESNEFLKSNYGMDNYCKFHIPLIMMQFPFAKTKESAKFLYQSLRYNSTGINYNLDDMETILLVDDNSPAYNAGIRKDDKIEKINNIKFDTSLEKAEEKYKQFIYNTFEFRDFKTLFTNAYGFERCAYWDKLKYPEIAEAFKSPVYQTTFAYLFNFQPFINPSGTNVVSFNIKRGKEKFQYNVWPQIKHEESFETIR